MSVSLAGSTVCKDTAAGAKEGSPMVNRKVGRAALHLGHYSVRRRKQDDPMTPHVSLRVDLSRCSSQSISNKKQRLGQPGRSEDKYGRAGSDTPIPNSRALRRQVVKTGSREASGSQKSSKQILPPQRETGPRPGLEGD